VRRYIIYFVACIALLLAWIDSTAVAVAYPVIITDFNISLVMAGWIITAYQVSLIAALPISGKISDVLGRKTTFLVFIALFLTGSVLCSLAPNAQLLILFRVMQGLGSSGLTPSVTGIIAEQFPNSRARAIGLMATIAPIGMILGPNLGGWMTSALGWRSIFWINIPICLIVLAVAFALLPKGEKIGSHFDLPGSGMMAVILITMMVGISVTGSADNQINLIFGILLLAISLVTGVFFWRRTKRVKDPVIEPEILREKPFLAANSYNFCLGCFVGACALIPLYAVSIYGLSTIASGFILSPRSIGIILASLITSLLLLRTGYRWPMFIGTVMVTICFMILALEPTSFGVLGPIGDGTVFLLVMMGLEGISEGVIIPPSNNACIEMMPQRIATITSIRGMFRQVGSVVGITIGSVILHSQGYTRGFQYLFLWFVAMGIFIMLPTIFIMTRRKQVTSNQD
jgi:EmrB/QacA subfamily drug resistance transporter